MSKHWQMGLDEKQLTWVLSGKKTIEGRLARGKFAEFAPGDTIGVRADWRDEHGVLHDGPENAATLQVVAVRRYPLFRDMLEAEGFAPVIPQATTLDEVLALCEAYYPLPEQQKYGVLAIEVEVL